MFFKGGPRGGAGSEKEQPCDSGGGPNISLEEKSKSKSRKAKCTSSVTPNAQSAVADIYVLTKQEAAREEHADACKAGEEA